MKKNVLFYIMFCLVGICILNACDDNGVGKPLATKMKMELSDYTVNIGKVAADTTVATIRWIDINSPSYTLTLSNATNATKLSLPDRSKLGQYNVKSMTLSDKQILDYLSQMELTDETTPTLQLKIAGTRTDGVADSISATINVTYIPEVIH
jgi:hypothetical protein